MHTLCKYTVYGKTFAVFVVFQLITKVFPLNHLLCTVHDGHGLMHCESFPVNSVFCAQPDYVKQYGNMHKAYYNNLNW